MVQEIIAVDAELQLLRFADLEVLEQPQIGVEVPWSVDGRQHRTPILPDLRREGEAVRVDELVRPQARSGVACLNRVQLYGVGSKQRHVADVVGGARNLAAIQVQVEVVVAAQPGQVGPAFHLGDAGDLPAVDESPQYLVAGRVPQLYGVGGVEDVRAVGGLHPVIVGQVKRVQSGVDDPHGFTESVVHVDVWIKNSPSFTKPSNSAGARAWKPRWPLSLPAGASS